MRTDGTCDTLFSGAISCRQPSGGYRFSLDAVLLAHFVMPGKKSRLVDLGAGCGVIGLIALYRHAHIASCLAIEAQDELASIAQENFRANGFADKTTVMRDDAARIREFLPAQCADLALCNPPYYQLGRGRKSRRDGECLARHQATPFAVFAQAAAWCLGKGGQAAFIYPAAQLAELFATCDMAKLAVKKLRLIHSYPGAAATRALILCRKEGGAGLAAAAPLFVYEQKNGRYSAEVARMYAANAAMRDTPVAGDDPCWRN
ncbi:MAG: methyltransferase [Desulfobulbaceae bacterium]|jgi:tRNA1Val (adenine37-N6)-methyltransferase|nr:methyltransferase [Desulfobulbaceae bacterium]